MLLRRDVLIAEENDDIFGKGPMDFIHCPVRQRLCEIKALDLCADDRGEFVDTDRFINMPIVKQHSLSRCTIGMKNLFGIIGGRRNQLHQQIDQALVDLAVFCKPTLTVIDATHVLLRGGPTGGSLDDVAVENSVICATDLVAADSRACEFLGLKGDGVEHIVLAAQSGLGNIDYRAAGYLEVA